MALICSVYPVEKYLHHKENCITGIYVSESPTKINPET